MAGAHALGEAGCTVDCRPCRDPCIRRRREGRLQPGAPAAGPPTPDRAPVFRATPDVPDRAETILRDLHDDGGFAIVAPHRARARTDPGAPRSGARGLPRDRLGPLDGRGSNATALPRHFHASKLAGWDGTGPRARVGPSEDGLLVLRDLHADRGGSYTAARAAADVALTGADLLLAGDPIVYGLCRPPGHHVGHRIFGGSSYLNNGDRGRVDRATHGRAGGRPRSRLPPRERNAAALL